MDRETSDRILEAMGWDDDGPVSKELVEASLYRAVDLLSDDGFNIPLIGKVFDRLRDHGWATDPDSLGAAWAEAEAALPEGCLIGGLAYLLPHDRETFIPGWQVDIGRVVAGKWAEDAPTVVGDGDTPAEALRDLAAKLRGRAP